MTKARARQARRLAPEAAPALFQQPVAVTQPMAEEAEHVVRYDAAIGPARDHPLAPADATSLREAMAAGGGGRLAEAKTIRDRIGDPAARKLVDWFVYRGGYGTASEIRAVLDGNPAWPDPGLLTQRAEEALFNGAASARDIKAFFA